MRGLGRLNILDAARMGLGRQLSLVRRLAAVDCYAELSIPHCELGLYADSNEQDRSQGFQAAPGNLPCEC